MKKLFATLLVVALLLPVLAGCKSATTNEATQPPAAATAITPSAPPATVPATTPAVQYITPDEAKTIALQDAGLSETEVRDLEVDLDLDDGPAHYDVDFEKDAADYDYDIDAVTGQILRSEKPAAVTASSSTPSSTGNSASGSSSKQLTRDEARDIALKHAGLKASEVRDLEVELDRDDGILHYDVDFEKDGYDYDYEIDAVSGKILKSRKERD